MRRSVTEAGAKEVNVVRAGATLVCCIGATIKVGIALKRFSIQPTTKCCRFGGTISADNHGHLVMRFFKPTIILGASTDTANIKTHLCKLKSQHTGATHSFMDRRK